VEPHLGRDDDPSESLQVRISGQTSIIDSVIVHVCYRQLHQQESGEASDDWRKPHVSRPWSSWGTSFIPVSAGVTVQWGTSNQVIQEVSREH